jgi:hypothetical protein
LVQVHFLDLLHRVVVEKDAAGVAADVDFVPTLNKITSNSKV